MKALLVGGTFDKERGKPSKIAGNLARSMGVDYINGGNLKLLETLDFESLTVLFWLPNIDNSEDKILPTIKKRNPKLLLIQSKRIIEKHYTANDVIGRLLQSHANLGIAIRSEDGKYTFQLLDPLGNQYCYTNELTVLADALISRIVFLTHLTRVSSTSLPMDESSYATPNSEFVEIVRSFGDRFTRFVNAVNPNRLLGNASTRCAKGFPIQRLKDSYLVSRRNVDKTTLSPEDFVEVKKNDNRVFYFGDVKPSVDTPIQILLFNYYDQVNYMIHGHVYVKDAPFTENKIPCGYLEEYDEIKQLFPKASEHNFSVNLKGHGCLIMASELDYFNTINLVGRPFPEL